MAYTGIVTTSTLSNLEKETYSTAATLITAEREAQHTAAILTNTEREAYETVASLSTLEDLVFATAALTTSLEREAMSTVGVLASLEGVVKVTIACLIDLVYKTSPTVEASAVIVDQRESAKRPVASARLEMIVPTDQLSRTFRFRFNAQIKQVTIKTPALDSGTAKVQIFDRFGARLYESGDAAQNTTTALISTEPFIPVNETVTVKVVASKVQATDVSFIVVLYGI